MRENTKGRLYVTTDDEYFVIGPKPDLNDSVAHVWLEGDARRLVACWNACEGVATEWLEQNQAVAGRDHACERARDELIATMRLLLDGGSIWEKDEYIARAVIAKAAA